MLRVCDILRRFSGTDHKVSVQGVGYVCLDRIHAGVVFLKESPTPVGLQSFNFTNELVHHLICFGPTPLCYAYGLGDGLVFTSTTCWNNTHLYTTLQYISGSENPPVYYKGKPVTGVDLQDGNVLLSTTPIRKPFGAKEILSLVKPASGVILELADCSPEFNHVPANIGDITCELVS